MAKATAMSANQSAKKSATVGTKGAATKPPPRSRATRSAATGGAAARSAPTSERSRALTPRSRPPIHADILAYNAAQSASDRRICDALAAAIDRHLPGKRAGVLENKIWHRYPVWFIDGNPIVGYHKLKDCIRLLFWSGQSFDEPGLAPEGSFKAAQARYTAEDQIPAKDLKRWLEKSVAIQWDYKNIVKRKGRLERLK